MKSMKLYNDDILIAFREFRGNIPYMVLSEEAKGVSPDDIPAGLFWTKGDPSKIKEEITAFEFLNWLKRRVFPEERYDCKDLLDDMGLDHYDPTSIAVQTQGVLYGVDKFWVDFEDGRGKPDV